MFQEAFRHQNGSRLCSAFDFERVLPLRRFMTASVMVVARLEAPGRVQTLGFQRSPEAQDAALGLGERGPAYGGRRQLISSN